MTAIYPTRTTILVAAAIAPVALAIGIWRPGQWVIGLILLFGLIALALLDAWLAAPAARLDAQCRGPAAIGVGEALAIETDIAWPNGTPRVVEVALGIDEAEPVGARDRPIIAARNRWRRRAVREGQRMQASIPLRAERRGTAQLSSLWIRWKGPLGLAWKQRRMALAQPLIVVPDIRPVREKSAQMVNPDAVHGQMAQLQVGEGAEFEALAQYRAGMDRRSIDWKQSARHTMLIAKEYRTERNNHVMLAVDSGRMMCEPLAARNGQPGVARIDRAVTAALLTAFVALRDGDRVGLFAFDSRPRASSLPISGPRAFPAIQRIAAGIDYGRGETNYTLAMATLAGQLARRSLVIVFTEFPDTISAELMLQAVGTLLKRHLVIFVVLKDEELEAFVAAQPSEPEDVSRAVMAAGLLRERRLVLTRLRHMGVQVIEASADEAGPALVGAYLDLKKRGAL